MGGITMEHIAGILTLWLLFAAATIEAHNTRSKLIFRLLPLLFAIIVSFWYLSELGILELTI